MSNLLPLQFVEINRTIREKTFITLWSWFLLVFVYQHIMYSTVIDLNTSGMIHFGEEFSPYQLVWAGNILSHIAKISIDIIVAIMAGITVGYLLTKARIIHKYFYSLFSTAIQLFLIIFIMIIVLSFSTLHKGIEKGMFVIVDTFLYEPSLLISVAINFITVIFSYYQGINIGIRIKEKNYTNMDIDKRNTFLDIKWYHWLWFWMPIALCFRTIFFYVFYLFVIIINNILSWKIFELFGLDTSAIEKTSITSAVFWTVLWSYAFFSQLKYAWKILSKRKAFKNKFISSIMVILFSVILPLITMLIIGIIYMWVNK